MFERSQLVVRCIQSAMRFFYDSFVAYFTKLINAVVTRLERIKIGSMGGARYLMLWRGATRGQRSGHRRAIKFSDWAKCRIYSVVVCIKKM